MTAPLLHAHTLGIDIPASVNTALKLFDARFHARPVAVWLHPDRVPSPWPPAWPPLVPNEKLDRNLVALEIGDPAPDAPQQPRLL